MRSLSAALASMILSQLLKSHTYRGVNGKLKSSVLKSLLDYESDLDMKQYLVSCLPSVVISSLYPGGIIEHTSFSRHALLHIATLLDTLLD